MTESMAVLRKMFGSDIPDAIDIVVPDWIDDPLTYGTYSSWPTGYVNQLYTFEFRATQKYADDGDET